MSSKDLTLTNLNNYLKNTIKTIIKYINLALFIYA